MSGASENTVMEFPWGAAAFILILAILFGGLARLSNEPLRVELYGQFQQIAAPDIHAALKPIVSGGFFGTSRPAVREELNALPWVRSVDLEILWPNRLAVRLVEHQPVAAMASGGVLVEGGSVVPVDVPGELTLPLVKAEGARLPEVAGVLGEVREACAGCRIDGLVLRAGNQLRLDLRWEGQPIQVELGRPDWRVALARLTEQALPMLRNRLNAVEAIDMRHRHAFAVRWLESTEGELKS